MPRTSGLLHEGKPIVQVGLADAVAVPSAVAPIAVAASFRLRTYRALIDTGADVSCVCDAVIRECALRQTGFMMITGGAGQNRHATYIVKLGVWCESSHDFEGEPQVARTLYQLDDPLEVVAIRDNAWCDIIIGTDVISQHELRIKKNEFTLILGEA